MFDEIHENTLMNSRKSLVAIVSMCLFGSGLADERFAQEKATACFAKVPSTSGPLIHVIS